MHANDQDGPTSALHLFLEKEVLSPIEEKI